MFEQYLREIRNNLGYLATWLPTEQIEVGSVGVLDKAGRFREETTLARLGIGVKTVSGTSQAQIKHRSVAGTAVDFKAAGKAPTTGSALSIDEAGFVVTFTRDNAIVFDAVGCRHERVEDVDDVGNQILQRVDARVWKDRYLVITGVVRADSATILMSKGSAARFEAAIGAAVATGTVSIGDAKLGLSMKHSSSLGIEIPAQTNLTPLYTAYHVRTGWWRAGKWEAAKSVFDGPLEESSIDDILDCRAAGAD